MKKRIAIDVIFTKFIDVEVPDIKGTEDADIIEQAVIKALETMPHDVNGFEWSWEQYEEV